MLTRTQIEEREKQNLAPFAVKACESKGRFYPESEHEYRTAFQRDRDRITFSAAFRRLQYKTQVFSNFEGDYYRTRLTHTIEVAQISRSIARTLLLNEDLTEAIALAHDLGHGPFGHIGETILNECMQGNGGFEHNSQSLRIVEELEDIYVHGKGLNLTRETKEGLQKHTYLDSSDLLPVSYSTLEAQIVDVSDELAYVSHDLDDGLRSGAFTEAELHDLDIWKRVAGIIHRDHKDVDTFQRLHLCIRYLINEQVTDLLKESSHRLAEYKIKSIADVRDCDRRLIDYSNQMTQMKKELKVFLFERFYRNDRVTRIEDIANQTIKGLFKYYSNDLSLMPGHFKRKAKKSGDKYRVICDYISGMTDRFIIEEYRKLRFGKRWKQQSKSSRSKK